MPHFRAAAALGLLLLSAAPARAARVDPLLPDDATTVAFVNVRQMVDLPPAKPFAESMLDFVLRLGPELRQALDALGIEPLEDIDTLTAAVEKGDRRTLIVRGRFDPAKIGEAVERAAKKRAGRIRAVKVEGIVVYEQKVGAETIYSAPVDELTLLVSWNKDRIVSAAGGGRREPKLSAKMQGLVAGMEDGQSVWAVFGEPRELLEATLDKLFNPLGLRLPIRPPLLRRLERPAQRVGSVTLAIFIGREINLAGNLHAEDRETATLLGEILAEKNALRLAVAANPLLGRARGEALSTLIADTEVTRDENDIRIRTTIADATLSRIMTPKP